MGTTLSQQIAAIQKARGVVERQIASKNPDELSNTSKELNDAGATIASLKSYLHTFVNACDKLEERRAVAFEFFLNLSKL